MGKIDINKISEVVKSNGVIGINNFLDDTKFEVVKKILADVEKKGIKKGNHTGVYPVKFKNLLVKILKIDIDHVKKTFLLKKIANELELEKIAERIFNKKVYLHMIDSYFSAKSKKHVLDWHCDRGSDAADSKTKTRIKDGAVKFFFYMNNVESGNGCLGYIPESHHIVKALAELVIDKKVNFSDFWSLQNLRNLITNDIIKKLIEEKIGNEKIQNFINNSKFIDEHPKDTHKFDLEMPKGSVVIFDEFGIHRGSAPSKNNRLVLRFHYCQKESSLK